MMFEKMRVNQSDPYLLMDSSASSSTVSVASADPMLTNGHTEVPSGFSNHAFPRHKSHVAVKPPIDRRLSVQNASSNSLHRPLSKTFHRRGSIPCLAASAQNSPQLSPKKSHTTPNPFPELINSSVPAPEVVHRRSRSSTVEEETWQNFEKPSTLTGSDGEASSTEALSRRGSKSTDYLDSTFSDETPGATSQEVSSALRQSSRMSGSSSMYDILRKGPAAAAAVTSPPRNGELRCLKTQLSSSSLLSESPTQKFRSFSFDRHSPTHALRHSPTHSLRHSPTGSSRHSPVHDSGMTSPCADDMSAVMTVEGYTKRMVKVYTDASNYQVVTITEVTSANEVCRKIAADLGLAHNINHALVEVLPKFDLGTFLQVSFVYHTKFFILRCYSSLYLSVLTDLVS